MIAAILDHLWQSTLVALGAGLLSLTLRKASAGVRHGLWFAASLKFLIPFAALAALGRLLAPSVRIPVAAEGRALVQAAAQPFSQGTLARFPLAHAPALHTPLATAPVAAPAQAWSPIESAPILLAVWALGCAVVLIVWAARWASVRKVARSARPVGWAAPMPVLASPSLMEPGLVGLFRPVLVIPQTLPGRLTRSEIEAVLAHEACHVRRRDNLTAAIHMLIEALCWFHPLVWWIGRRLIAERERACDEAVVRQGHDRTAYARSLVESARLYLQSPLGCVAGAAGSNLKARVEAILTAAPSSPLSPLKKALLLAAGGFTFASPVLAGLLVSPEGQTAIVRAAAAASVALGLPAAVPAPNREQVKPVVPARDRPAAPAVSAVARADAPEPAPSQAIAETASPEIVAESNLPAAPPPTPAGAAPAAPQPAMIEVAVTPSGGAQDMSRPKAIEQMARSFTATYAAPGGKIGQIARWHEALCVKVDGVIPVQAAKIQARVEEVAQGVGLPVNKPGCRSNIQIVFTAQPQGFIDRIAQRNERYLGFHYRGELNRVKAVTRPIQSWYATATQGGVGDNVGPGFIDANVFGGVVPGQSKALETLDIEDGHTPTGCGDAPRFTSCLRSVFKNVLVVVDSRAVEGRDLGSVADYLAMLALSQPKSLDGCSSLASVIDLFARSACPGRDAPDGLTAADASYLTALYQIDPEAKPMGEVADLAGRMGDILIGAWRVAAR